MMKKNKPYSILKNTVYNHISEIKITYKPRIKKIDRIKLTSSQDSYKAIKQLYNPNEINYREHCYIISLNRNSEALGWYEMSSGGTAGSVMDIKIICQIAINTHASAIILTHNHPSGNLNPSNTDKTFTKRIKEALNLFDIELLDHLIITDDSYTSFADEGIL